MESIALSNDVSRANILDAATIEHILSQIGRELDAEVTTQNREDFQTQARLQRYLDMREISSMAQTLRDAIAKLKAQTLAVTSEFATEVGHSNASIVKVQALTKELKEANLEVEQMLGQSGSNFSPSGVDHPSNTPVDSNGVWVNPEAPKK